jgi:hypothetical protein
MSKTLRPETVPATLAEGIEMAERQGLEPTTDYNGRHVDPLPIQAAAIREGFQAAAKEDGFNVFTVVDPSVLREGDPLQENFRLVFNRWEEQTDKVAAEIANQIEDMGYDLEDADGA